MIEVIVTKDTSVYKQVFQKNTEVLKFLNNLKLQQYSYPYYASLKPILKLKEKCRNNKSEYDRRRNKYALEKAEISRIAFLESNNIKDPGKITVTITVLESKAI